MINQKPPVITARNLSASYKDHMLWQGANFTINSGEFVAILGPNGAGKTTLFRLLLGLLKPSSGHLELFGEYPQRGNAHIGYVPQRRLVDSDLKIEALEVVRLGMSGLKWGCASLTQASSQLSEAFKALELVDAGELAHRSLGELSGGELQRVFLAQALVCQPELLLLDEPLANLDIKRTGNLVQLVSSIVKTHQVTTLLIAHDINPLLPVLDKVIYIANNKLLIGPPSVVITSETLSALYNASVEVVHDSHGRVAVLGAEEAIHHHD